MDLNEKIRTLPTGPGCYLYKNAEGEVIYVGKAKNLRARVRSYFLQANQLANRKTGSLMREAVDLEYITVANEHEALALENNLIKQRKPRFNILLRDDKTYPYIKLTLTDKHPKVFVTRRLRKDGSAYYGPYFPGNLAWRLKDVIHRSFLIPSCKVDLNRYHPRACLQYYIKRCMGPCVEGFVRSEDYAQAVRDVQLFLDGKTGELEVRLTQRMEAAAADMQFEQAARLRDQLITVSQAQDRQRMASPGDEDADVFGFHFENDMLAVNLFHMRGGKIVDRRDLFWEELPEMEEEDGFGEGLAEGSEKQVLRLAALAQDDNGVRARDDNAEKQVLRLAALAQDDNGVRARDDDEEKQVLRLAALAQDDNGVEAWDDNAEKQVLRLAALAQDDNVVEPVPTESAPEICVDEAAMEQYSVLAPGEEAAAFSPAAFFSALLKQMYLDQGYVPRHIYVPVDFPDRELLAEALRERSGHKIEIAAPQRGDKRSLVDLVCQNAKQSYEQRFRVLKPSQEHMQEALQDALMLAEPPTRIECFDISHIQGAETVASMVVWEKDGMKKSAYRKFQVKTVSGVDDFAAMREIIHRRYKRLQEDGKELPSLVLIDGGLGQLHAAAAALEEIGLAAQPLASIAKREEIIYVYGQEDEPVVLDRRSPVLHVVQMIRDESHRFAVTYHRKRRAMRDRVSELDEIPGVGPRTRQRLLEHFGSVRALKQAAEKNPDALLAVVNKASAEKIRKWFAEGAGEPSAEPLLPVLG